MKELTAAENVSSSYTSVALGIFDGVHRGHRSVIGQAVRDADENGYAAAVCTFKTGTVDTKGSKYQPIYSDETKSKLLEKEGAEYIYMPDFSEIRQMPPETFVEEILRNKLNAATVVCGRDFRLGKGAVCGTEGLSELCSQKGMKLIVVDDVSENGIRICSADIRENIRSGNMRAACRLLGHDYAISGEVIHGNHFGRVMNFPTANQKLDEHFVLPKFGVYASYTEIDGKIYKGITNIGVKPTVDSSGIPLSETHFPNYSGDLYGKSIVVHLIDFIRSEMRFENAQMLKKQIAKDVCAVMETEYMMDTACIEQ